MNRQVITTEDGQIDGWFDYDKATRQQDTNNNDLTIGHAWLYRTAGGVFILNHWDHYQGSRETYTRASNQEVAEWALRFEEVDGFDYPPEILEIIKGMEV